jgi:hypothetical protein
MVQHKQTQCNIYRNSKLKKQANVKNLIKEAQISEQKRLKTSAKTQPKLEI